MKRALVMILSTRAMHVASRIMNKFLRDDAASSSERDLQKFLTWCDHKTIPLMVDGLQMGKIHVRVIQGEAAQQVALPERDPACKEKLAFISRTPWNVVHPGREVYHG